MIPIDLCLLSCIICGTGGDRLLSTKEAAEQLGLSPDHVRRLLEQGKITGKKIGNSWVVLELDYKRKRRPKTRKGGS